MTKAIRDAKEQVLWGCKTMCGRGYVLGTAGNISARVARSDLFVVTPTSLSYDMLRPEDLVVADMDGAIVEGNLAPSIEFTMHRSILMKRPDVRCVVHTHSKFATAAGSMAGVSTVPVLDIETAMYIGGDIAVAAFAAPGSAALAANVAEALGDRAGVIMEGHGAVGVGGTMQEAMTASDILERTCEMFLLIKAAGEIKPLDTATVRELCENSRIKRGITN